jgi:hypothetical protein
MPATIEVLDPTYEETATELRVADRADTLTGRVVGIVSNGKHGTGPFFDSFAAELRDRFGVREVVRVVKPNYSAPAGEEILDAARRWHALVAGIGD